MIPKSKTLRNDADARESSLGIRSAKTFAAGEAIPVKKVKCYNDFVAILQFRIESTVLVTENAKTPNEGMVIGIGPGLPGPSGQRTPSQLSLGDMVTFYGNPVTVIDSTSGSYAGHRVIIVPERAVICGIKSIPFKIVDEENE